MIIETKFNINDDCFILSNSTKLESRKVKRIAIDSIEADKKPIVRYVLIDNKGNGASVPFLENEVFRSKEDFIAMLH